eukprot:Gb_30259 [translate_table: standard]
MFDQIIVIRLGIGHSRHIVASRRPSAFSNDNGYVWLPQLLHGYDQRVHEILVTPICVSHHWSRGVEQGVVQIYATAVAVVAEVGVYIGHEWRPFLC